MTTTLASGVAPLTVRFEMRYNTDQPLARIDADFDGDGTIDFITSDPSALIERTYTAAGVHQARITVTDSQNTAFSQTFAIVVQDAGQVDQFFTGLWNGMNEALKAGNLDAALSYLNESAKRKYQPVFEALKPHLVEIVTSYSAPARLSVSENIGEYVITRPHAGETRAYLIYFLMGPDGVWRIDSM